MKTRTRSAPRARKVAAGGVTPCGDYVLVEVVAETDWNRTPAGLHVPASALPEKGVKRGTVVAVSPHVRKAKFGVAPGDTVMISKFARTEEVGGGRVLVHAEAIMAVSGGGA